MSLKNLSIFNVILYGLSLIINILANNANDIVNFVLNFLTFNFWGIPDFLQSSNFLKWAYVLVLLNVYGFFVYGVYSLISRSKYTEKSIICENELIYTIDHVSNITHNMNSKLVAFVNLIKEYERELVKILGENDKANYRFYWIIPDQASSWKNISIHSQNPSTNEKNAIDNALASRRNYRFNNSLKEDYPNDNLHEMVLVRNYGDLVLGFTILSYKKGLITKEKGLELKIAASQIVLLGQVDNLKQVVINL